MRVQQVDEGAEYGLERRSVIAAGAVAGIVGPILFTVTFFVQGLFRLEEYDPVAEVVSALEARWLGAAGELRSQGETSLEVFSLRLLLVRFAVERVAKHLYHQWEPACSPVSGCNAGVVG
jgi:hypothetical protein